MTTNMGKLDRGARLAIAALLLVLVFGTTLLGGVLTWIAVAVAAVFAVTALVGNCPLYSVIGLKTCSDC
jgi:hypothetical protein